MTPPLGARFRGRGYLPPLILSSLTIMLMIFLLCELIQKNFFAELDAMSLHYLYITRGLVLGGALTAWAVWFVSRHQAKYEAERADLHEHLSQAEKLTALGELIGGVAHEINNPIGIILSRLEIMIQDAQGAGLPQGHLSDLEVLRKHAMRVGSVARNLLSFAKKSSAEKKVVDLNAVVKETIPLVDCEFKKQGISLDISLAQNLPNVHGNFNQLQQVLVNIMTNARDALRENAQARSSARIQVATRKAPANDGVRLCVVDNGPAIAEEHIYRLFDPFFTTKEGGTGLGLSVSHGIVQEHGGTLKGCNDGRHKSCGTCFMVSLPTAKESA